MQLALVTYTDERGREQTQLTIVGDNTVHLLDSRTTGIGGRGATTTGPAVSWLRDGVFKLLSKVKKTKKGE